MFDGNLSQRKNLFVSIVLRVVIVFNTDEVQARVLKYRDLIEFICLKLNTFRCLVWSVAGTVLSSESPVVCVCPDK